MRAFVTGATGQDGTYLCELLLSLGYEVHGLRRPATSVREYNPHVIWHDGDMTDGMALSRIVQGIVPGEIYNLAAQSHVGCSFKNPDLTFQVNALGTLRLLEAAKAVGARFYQASTSELFGNAPAPQSETTPFYPRSPYGVAKLAAYWSVVNYRESYALFACNGILFNHESPRRGLDFVTRKISRAVAEIANGSTDVLRLGNLDAKRDWGHARDYVRAMHLMLQHHGPEDFVIATGESHTVREFVELAFACIGMDIEWHSSGVNESGIDRKTGRLVVAVDPQFYRPAEVNHLEGDSSKARATLKWSPTVTFRDLVSEMVSADVNALRTHAKALRAA